MEEKPVFEMRSADGANYIRVYASGRVESTIVLPQILINRIPLLIAEARSEGTEKAK